MADTPAGPISQLADALLQVLSENLPRDLRWQWMLLMIALALGIWVMRNGHGAKSGQLQMPITPYRLWTLLNA
jgi:hypothetical protein